VTDRPADRRYSREHEWVLTEGGTALVGITDYAQEELGDVVYVDLPKIGASLGRMDVFGTIEAVKAVSELFSPASGTVLEGNSALESDPAKVNRDPYGEGWMIRLRMKNATELDQLLGAAEYAKHVGQ